MRRLPKQTGARVRAKHRRPKGQEATETQPGCVTFLTLAKILPAFPEFGEISPTLIVADVAAFTPEDFLYPRRGASEACFRTGVGSCVAPMNPVNRGNAMVNPAP